MSVLKVALLGAPADLPAFHDRLAAAIAASPHAHEAMLDVASGSALPPDAPDLTLLLGASSATRPVQAQHTAIRDAIAHAGQPYQVLYGSLQECVQQAFQLIAQRLGAPAPADEQQRPWVWMCDKCSDPACEHALLTGLLAQRRAA
ncbi:MAG: hypothetical protein JWQ72_288 [Polaromonas sp.]|nr:hypothetical protein [Polaromonas sp.]